MFTVIHLAWKSLGQDVAPECKFKCALLAILCRHKTYRYILVCFFQQPMKITLKKCWVVLTQFWVKYGQTQVTSCWLHWVTFL